MNSTIQMKLVLKKFFLGIFAFIIIVFIMSILPSLLDYVYVTYIDKYVSRKALFIFCNAILLFIVRDSGLLVLYSTNKQQGNVSGTNIRDLRLQKDGIEVKTSAVVEEETNIDQTVDEIEELEVVNMQSLLHKPIPIIQYMKSTDQGNEEVNGLYGSDQTVEEMKELEAVKVQSLLHKPIPIIQYKKTAEEDEVVNGLYESATVDSKEERSDLKSRVKRKSLVHFTLSKRTPSAPLYTQNVENTTYTMKEELENDEYDRRDDIILQKPDSRCVLDVDINEEMREIDPDMVFNRRCDEFITKFRRELSGRGTMEAV